MADIETRLDHIEGKVDEIKNELDEVLDRVDIHSASIQSLDQWRKGNGAKGAEARIQGTEDAALSYYTSRVPERLNCVEVNIEALQRIADGKIQDTVSLSVHSAMDARDRTAIAYIKAFAPWVAALLALAATLIGAIK